MEAPVDKIEIELPPADVVPRCEVTPVVAELLAGAVGTQVEVHFPGEVIEDPDGIPIGVTEQQTVNATLARLHITEGDTDDDPTD
jgi:hypothetical protein